MTTASQGIEGRLIIDLSREGGRLSARIASTRPVGLARAFAGRDPAEVLATIPLLFTLCGVAHSVAAVEAYEEAHGLAAPPATTAARRISVLAETAREHFLRMALDWPRFLSTEPDKAPMPRIMALLPQMRRVLSAGGDPFKPGAAARIDAGALEAAIAALGELLQTNVFGEPAEAWLSRRSGAGLADWAASRSTTAARFIRLIIERGWQSLGAGETRFLPALDRETAVAALGGGGWEAFLAAPVWEGEPHETTPLARQRHTPLIAALMAEHGAGLLTRACARLVELAAIPAAMHALAGSIQAAAWPAARHAADGAGLAQVEAARGRLVHYLRLDGARVGHYAILAPTEWNFHPRGAAVHGLQSLRAEDTQELCAQADTFINVIDPCVSYELRLH